MSRRYDQKTTTFTNDGKLLQVQYAIEAINKTGSAIGILTKEGVVLTTERQDVSSLLEAPKHSEKIFQLDSHLYSVVNGLTADANYLIDIARVEAQTYKYTYGGDNIPIEQLLVRICDIKQSYTQIGGLRPFGAAFLFAGYDRHQGYQLYSTDPSGNYFGWKAIAIGQKNAEANGLLKPSYKVDITLKEGINLGVKALVKTMDTANPSAKKIEMVVISENPKTGKVEGRTLKEAEIRTLLEENGFNVEK